jgi:ribosomal protein S18 acetylase RimI-like enzyme
VRPTRGSAGSSTTAPRVRRGEPPRHGAGSDGEVVLRDAERRDLPALVVLPGLSASTRRQLVAEVARASESPAGDTIVLVASAAGEVLGAALGLLQVDDGHVVDLAVAPPIRRRGVGRRLLSALTAELRGRGARAITLEVRAGNLGRPLAVPWCGLRGRGAAAPLLPGR